MIFRKSNFLTIENIKGSVNISNKRLFDGYLTLKFQFAYVYDWYDETVYLTGHGRKCNGNLDFTIYNGLKQGLYILICIMDINDNTLVGTCGDNINFLDALFVSEKPLINATETYLRVIENRENEVLKPKGYLNNNDADKYDVYIFCKNISVSTRAQYGPIELIPYDYLWMTGEVDYINAFFKENTSLQIEVSEEPFKTSIPSAVFCIKNILACNYDEAEEYALNKAGTLNNIFTMLKNSHGEFFSSVVLKQNDQVSRINMLNTRYKGNLLDWAEKGFSIRHYFNYLSTTNTYILLYIELLNEAMKEDNRMMQYYRYWNILESIAGKKQYSTTPMRKWDDTIVTFHSKIVKIGNEPLNIVFELAREHLGRYEEKDFITGMENVKSVKEFISICYQRRNCCAHQGDCFLGDSNICLGKTVMIKCKESMFLDKTQPEAFRDKLLRKLRDITFQIVISELNNVCGEVKKENDIVNYLLNERDYR